MAVPGGSSAVLDQGRPAVDLFEGYDRARALAEVSRYCDIEERLTLVPPSAKVRGTYARSIDAALIEAGQHKRYRELFPRDLGTLQWHPCGEFLVRLVVGGALLQGPERVKEGMLEIGRRNALEFARSLLGRMLLRLLSHDPKKLLLQGVAARRQTASYGDWQVTFPKERTAIVKMVEEYMYLETFMLGAALGTFDAIGLKVEASAELQTKFHGRHVLQW
jgi:uncharacterized protein (TIGR02265 family)